MADGVRVQVGNWDDLGPAARSVRFEVFVREQGIPADLEMDIRDATAVHAVAFDAAGTALATGRLLPDAHIGRMAVLQAKRGHGLGAIILRTLVAAAHARGDRVVRLHAQAGAVGFYLREGFVTEGGEFLEAGIAHQTMVLGPMPA